VGTTHSGIGVELEGDAAVLFEMGLDAFAKVLKDGNGPGNVIDAGADSVR